MAIRRDDYVEKLKTQLDKWNAEMGKWEAQAGKAQEKMRGEYEIQLAALRHHRDQALAELRKLQSASGDAWMELTKGADESWASMRAAFDKAASHLKNR